MTASDISIILASLNSLTTKLDAAMERLARIEERSAVLADHEMRMRSTEESARMANVTAAHVKTVTEILEGRVQKLEAARTFTWSVIFKVGAGAVALLVSGLAIASYIKEWL